MCPNEDEGVRERGAMTEAAFSILGFFSQSMLLHGRRPTPCVYLNFNEASFYFKSQHAKTIIGKHTENNSGHRHGQNVSE